MGLPLKSNGFVRSIEKLWTWGHKLKLVDRMVTAFFVCSEIWRRSWAFESLKSRIKNTWERIKAGENDQPEALSHARNGFGYDNNEGENFNDKKHCKTLSGVSINSNQMQSPNKNRALHFTGSKTSCGQIKEMWNNRRHKKTNKKVAQRSNKPADGWNQLWSFNTENEAA